MPPDTTVTCLSSAKGHQHADPAKPLTMKSLDPMHDDAGVRLRTLRLRRGLSQVALAELACISPTLLSMVETGQRSLRSASHIFALADALRVSPLYLADGQDDAARPVRLTPGMVPFPVRADPSS